MKYTIPDSCSQTFLLKKGLSKTSLFRYRRFAIAYIPDYTLICERWWFIRHNRPHNPDLDGSIDRPPYCRLQVEVLLAVRTALKHHTSFEFKAAQKFNPSFWRKFQ